MDLLYPSPEAFFDAPSKAIALFGMSGVGKTYLANMLRADGRWYHYSVDYRIGTRYMNEHIADNLKREAMRSPFLREQLKAGCVSLAPVMSFQNLSALSNYLGKPGAAERGGLGFETYLKRQREHREAEIMSLLDAPVFAAKARDLYGYPHFLCDTSGSLVEVVDPDDPDDPLLTELTRHMLFVYIRGHQRDREELERRFERAPKPMYYDEAFLLDVWETYLTENDVGPEDVDPDAFVRWGFRRLIDRRAPRYEAIARNWGVLIDRDAAADASEAEDFLALVREAIAQRGSDGPPPFAGGGS